MSQNINKLEGFPVLQSERLSLVQLHQGHGDALYEMRKNPTHHQYTDTLPDQSIEETRAYIVKMLRGVSEGKWFIWGIEDKQTSKLLGTVSLWNFDGEKNNAELGFGLLKEAQGQGYMREALEVVTEYGFEKLNLKEIHAYTEGENISSIQLLEKMGFELSDTIEENGYQVDKIFKMRVYVLKNR